MKTAKNALCGAMILLLAWWLVSALKLADSFFLPGPVETIANLANLIVTGSILPDLAFTLGRVVAAFLVALAVGLPAGLVLGSSKRLYGRFEFLIDFFRSIPATAMFPLFLLVLGIGDESKIAVAAFTSALIIMFNTAHGVMHSKKARVLAAKLMGATKTQIFRHISFWESLPQTFAGIRTAISLSLIVVIVTEMFIGTHAGLGKRIIDAQYVYNIKEMYSVIIITGIIGYSLNMVIALIEKKMIRWAGK